jgi:predicted MPP superfamily phosphohydrolase
MRRTTFVRCAAWAAAAGAAAAAYMLYESQWLQCREESLPVLGLPPYLEGLRVLHMTDVHAGQPGLNVWTFRKALRWAGEHRADLVVLTGDILGGGNEADECLRMLSGLRAPLGVFAVPGNHEYGLSKNPFAHRPFTHPWEAAGIHMLRDECRVVMVDGPPAAVGGPAAAPGGRLLICGADYLTGGYGLADRLRQVAAGAEGGFPLLLTHRPPNPDDRVFDSFPLIFAGHTHGGQIRLPSPRGPILVHKDGLPYVEGIHHLRGSVLVLSRGVGTSFLPFRLMTRPEVVLYHLTSAGAVGTG